MEKVGKFYAHFAYFTAKWYILGPFNTFCDHLVHIFLPVFGMLYREKSGNLARRVETQPDGA
jgi:hypothetical protein